MPQSGYKHFFGNIKVTVPRKTKKKKDNDRFGYHKKKYVGHVYDSKR